MSQELKTLRESVAELSSELERLSQGALPTGVVAAVTGQHVYVAASGSVMCCKPSPRIKVQTGDTVRLHGMSLQIVEAAPCFESGTPVRVSRLDDQGRVFISMEGTEKIIFNGTKQKLEEGMTVLCDPSNTVAMKVLAGATQKFKNESDVNVHWDDIIGNDEAKQSLRDALTLPLLSNSIIKAYGYTPPKGVLLYGPPGCGKTMLAKAGATHIAKMNNAVKGGFIYIKGPQILDPYVGVTEATIRELFASARRFKKETGTNALLFIDEADAILGKRGTRDAHMEKTIVPTFLAEMDGLDESGAFVMLATNRPDSLDDAVGREGRIDAKVKVARPTPANAAAIVANLLKKTPIAKDEPIESLAKTASEYLFLRENVLARIYYEGGEYSNLRLSDVISGAMATDVALKARNIALRRDMAGNGKTVSGVCTDDIARAVATICRANVEVDHNDAIFDMAGDRKIINVEKVQYAETA